MYQSMYYNYYRAVWQHMPSAEQTQMVRQTTVVRRPSSSVVVGRRSSVVVRRLSSVVHRPSSSVVRCLSVVVRCRPLLFVVRCPLSLSVMVVRRRGREGCEWGDELAGGGIYSPGPFLSLAVGVGRRVCAIFVAFAPLSRRGRRAVRLRRF